VENLFNAGRIFYSIAIAGMGAQCFYHKEFPYMLIPPNHSSMPWFTMVVYISGTLLILAGTLIVFEIKTRKTGLLLGTVLLLIFCFYFVPYEFLATSDYMRPGEWENAEKELALSAGAFVIARGYPRQNENSVFKFLGKLSTFGTVIFSLTIISFGIDHFLYAKDVAEYISSWIPWKIFWTYLAGAALLSAGIAIFLKINIRLSATLLGAMIFVWFIILHIPKAIGSPAEDLGGEVTSAFLALAYCGIAFVIAAKGRNEMAAEAIARRPL
jgi:uncharacterized membrane protein